MMFHFSDDEITNILNIRTKDDFTYFTSVATRFRQEYKPLFFTPYRSICEFGQELIAPLETPIRLAGMSAASALFALLAAAASVAALLISSTAALMMQTKVQESAFNFACKSLIVLGSGLIFAASCFLLAIASVPYTLFSLALRSITSLTTKTEAATKEVAEITLTDYSTSCSF